MKVIGEKINGTRKKVKEAVLGPRCGVHPEAGQRPGGRRRDLDRRQRRHPREREPEDLIWLVQTVQAAVDKPLCLDSANPSPLAAALPEVKQAPLMTRSAASRDGWRACCLWPLGRRAA